MKSIYVALLALAGVAMSGTAQADAALALASNFFERVSARQTGLSATIEQLNEVDAERKLINDSLSKLRQLYNIYHIDDAGPAVSEILAQKMRTEPKFNELYDHAKSMELYIYSLELRFQDLPEVLTEDELRRRGEAVKPKQGTPAEPKKNTFIPQ